MSKSFSVMIKNEKIQGECKVGLPTLGEARNYLKNTMKGSEDCFVLEEQNGMEMHQVRMAVEVYNYIISILEKTILDNDKIYDFIAKHSYKFEDFNPDGNNLSEHDIIELFWENKILEEFSYANKIHRGE